MKLQIKTALGIDISCSRINMVLLRKDKNGLKLLKAVDCPVPDGAIKNGNIENAEALAGAIKQLKTENKIHANYTALSPIVNPMLMQIFDIPDDASGNIKEFIQNETKQYAKLSMKDVVVDYCGIKSSGKTGARRAFAVATDGQKISDFVKTINTTEVDINAVEPALVAYLRACYTQQIAKRFEQVLLFAIVHNNVLVLCLFKNQTLDFVQKKHLALDESEPDKYCEWIMENINTVLKFYGIKSHDKCDKWEVTIVIDSHDNSIKQRMESLAPKLKVNDSSYDTQQNNISVELKVRSLEDAYLDTPIADSEHQYNPSVIAVGLAMKPLNCSDSILDINLLPAELAMVKPIGKQALVVANIAAAVLILLVLSIGFYAIRVKNVKDEIERKQQAADYDVRTLLNEQALLTERIANTSENLDNMNNILNTSSFVRWDQVLDEIRHQTPKPVRITNLFSDDGLRMVLKGEALSYESVHIFVSMLNQSEHIKSASLIGTEKDDKLGRLIMYSISCSLAEQGGVDI